MDLMVRMTLKIYIFIMENSIVSPLQMIFVMIDHVINFYCIYVEIKHKNLRLEFFYSKHNYYYDLLH